MYLRYRALICSYSLIYASVILFFSGWVQIYEHWYSPFIPYRLQTDALLNGNLELCDNVLCIDHDLTWSMQGVHQVWGIGIPLWRLPLEIFARVLGHDTFPDRLAFGLFAMMVAYCVIGYSISRKERNRYVNLSSVNVAFPMVLLFPPFLSLMKTRGGVWEEAIAYEYLYAILLLTLLLRLYKYQNITCYAIICLLSGIGGLIRPTLIFYGISTVAISMCIIYFRNEDRYKSEQSGVKVMRHIISGSLLLCLGCGLLWTTNALRFGGGLEFGHKLNLQNISGSMYSTKFDCPYQSEPLDSSAKELFGALFMSFTRYNGSDWYQENIFEGQSKTSRWREIYFRTYDLSYIVLIMIVYSCIFAQLLKIVIGYVLGNTSIPMKHILRRYDIYIITAAWSFIAAVPICMFYLRTPVISSRYMVDLAPAFSSIVLCAWLLLLNSTRNTMIVIMVLGTYIIWYGTQFYLIESAYTPPNSVTKNDIVRIKSKYSHDGNNVVFTNMKKLNDKTEMNRIPYDCTGWHLNNTNSAGINIKKGTVKPIIVLFMKDIEFVELELVTQQHPRISADINDIRVKSGLEQLIMERYAATEYGYIVRYKKPKNEKWSKGIQVVYVATVSNEHFAEEYTPWILKTVKWRD